MALFLSAAALCWIAHRTSNLQKALTSPTDETKLFCKSDLEKAIPAMKETNDLLINWSIALLGGTIGIVVLAKGAKIRDRNWGMILIPPAWTFLLLGSLWNGSLFKRSLTFQLAKGEYKFSDLNLYLYLQLEFFGWGLCILALIALYFLFFRFALKEEKSDGGD